MNNEPAEEPDPENDRTWSFLPSPSTLGHWLAKHAIDGTVTVYAPPGVSITEDWDDDSLLHWREARWSHASLLDAQEPPTHVRRLSGLADAVALVPADALADRGVHRWMVEATELHADALERLALMQEAQGDEASKSLAAKLKRIVRAHRKQAARAGDQLSSFPLSAQDVARLVEQRPRSLVAQIERSVAQAQELPHLAAVVADLEERYGTEFVRDALVTLLYARDRSRSWQMTRPARHARRTARRQARKLKRVLTDDLSLADLTGPAPTDTRDNLPANGSSSESCGRSSKHL
jgi:hypothetical protein